MTKPTFEPGRNIAMKIPAHEHEQTVAFYRDILGLEEIAPAAREGDKTPRFVFGDRVLWLDCIAGISQAEIWLEIVTPDIENSAEYFAQQGCIRRDEIEPLPDGFSGFWLSSPANIIHLITQSAETEGTPDGSTD